MNIDYIENKIGYVFNDKKLLARCFTHSSYANEHKVLSNENLEFLGDSVLNFVITEELCNIYRDECDEGVLSKIRAKIVSTESLLEVCENLALAKELSYIADSKSVLRGKKQFADLIEALIAGLYLDGGLDCAKRFILNALSDRIKNETPKIVAAEDYKTALQELSQKHKLGEIKYVLEGKSGLDHSPKFYYIVEINSEILGKGEGGSKKIAQTLAAKEALITLKIRGIEN